MRLTRSVHSFVLFALTVIALCAAQTVFAQTTVFAYQGKLDIDGAPVSGDYDFQFKLFDAVTDGAQLSSTIEQLNVSVTNGAYTVNLVSAASSSPAPTGFLKSAFDRPVSVRMRPSLAGKSPQRHTVSAASLRPQPMACRRPVPVV